MGPEANLEKYFKKRVEALGGICWKLTSPGRRGVPDRLVAHIHFPSPIMVELKSKSGKLSIHQRKAISRLTAAGVMVLVLDSIKAVDDFVDDFILWPENCECPVCTGDEANNEEVMH